MIMEKLLMPAIRWERLMAFAHIIGGSSTGDGGFIIGRLNSTTGGEVWVNAYSNSITIVVFMCTFLMTLRTGLK